MPLRIPRASTRLSSRRSWGRSLLTKTRSTTRCSEWSVRSRRSSSSPTTSSQTKRRKQLPSLTEIKPFVGMLWFCYVATWNIWRMFWSCSLFFSCPIRFGSSAVVGSTVYSTSLSHCNEEEHGITFAPPVWSAHCWSSPVLYSRVPLNCELFGFLEGLERFNLFYLWPPCFLPCTNWFLWWSLNFRHRKYWNNMHVNCR